MPTSKRPSPLALSRQRQRLIPQAIALGILTGGVAVAFHIALDSAEALRGRIIEFARQQPNGGPGLVLGLSLAALLVSACLVLYFAPEASGSGIPHLKTVLQGRRPFRWVRVLLVKFASTVAGVAGGLVLGRGGPTVHMGGAIGQGVANAFTANDPEARVILIAAGAGAGLAAAFNAPLAGLVFVLEELEWRCASVEFVTVAVACLSADMVCRALLGQHPIFYMVVTGSPPLELLAAFVPLGLLSGLFGGLFNRCLLDGQQLARLPPWPRLGWWLVCGLSVATTGWLYPEILGSGQVFVGGVLDGNVPPLQTAALIFTLRFLLTVGSSSTGVAGGIFIPILMLGALLGLLVAGAIQQFFPGTSADPRLFSAVGMAAYFTGVVHAPLTAIVLIIEMTGNYELIMPLFVGCFSALMAADWLGSLPIYEALLENSLRKDRFQQSD